MDAEKVKNLDGALLNLFTSAELWIAIGAVVFFFIVMHVKRVLDARSTRMFGRQRFGAQSNISIGSVYWFGNAIGADPWVLVGIDNDYMRFEDKTRVRFIPTKNFPNIEWTMSKVLSSDDVLSGLYDIKLRDINTMPILQAIIDKVEAIGNDETQLKLD